MRIDSYFESFTPDYPNPTKYEDYGNAVRSIEDLYLCSDDDGINYTDRTSADAVGITLIVKIALQSLQISVNELLKDSLPHWFVYYFKVVPYIANGITINSVDTIYEQAALHDGLVDGAEMEAIYENSLQLLDGSASIYDEVVCRCTKEPRRGQGCDSIDNDCDKTVDECDEDAFKLEIDIADASLNCASGNGQTKWFTADEDALECVNTYASVADDCDTTIVMDDPVLAGTCGDATITLSASDRCGNLADDKVVPVFIDKEKPVVSCSLSHNDNTADVIFVTAAGAGVMQDVELVYDATDNCGFDMDVKVEVFANEIEDFQNQETAILYRNGMSQNRVGLYVASDYCSTSSTGQCVKDPNFDERVYTIVISATDEAGNAAVPAQCQVVILPQNGQGGDFTLSTQRFHLTSYSSTFKDYD